MTPMIKPKLTFFKMQVKSAWAHSPEPGEAAFGVAPEAFDAVDMGPPVSEFITAMIDPEMLPIADINQAIVAAPAVGIDNTLRGHLAPYNRLQRGFGAIRDDFRIDFPVAFEDAEYDSFAVCSTPSLALDCRAPKNDSSTSTSPENGDLVSQKRASCILTALRYLLIVFRLRPVISAIWVASKSMAKYRIICRN